MMSKRRLFGALLSLVMVVSACNAESGGEGDPVATPRSATTVAATVPSATSTVPPPTTTVAQVPTESLPGVDRILSGSESFPDGFEIPAGEVWAFDPTFTTMIESGGNVVVRGTLVMKPTDDTVDHTLRFVGIVESGFQGGGHDPLPTDVGMWVVDDGALDLVGEEKPAWDYLWHDEWAGDEVVAAPNTPGDYATFATVAGPADVPKPNELGFATELLNLTRNVHIEGTAEGRTHVFIHSTQPQTIRYVAIRYVGPDFGVEVRGNRAQGGTQRNVGSDVTGRYGLHFHRGEDGSRGSIVEGVVVRDADNHAFVPHNSNGITFRDTIAFNTQEEAYWWDPALKGAPTNASDDVLYDHVIAAGVTVNGTGSAFALSDGDGNVIVDSVAVGVSGRGSSMSGYHWPGTEKAVWDFVDNVAHNNSVYGIRVWQNTSDAHLITDFLGYHNGVAGIAHGAYTNSYTYRDLTLLANGEREGADVAIEANAVGRPSRDGTVDLQQWTGIETGGAEIVLGRHAASAQAPVRFVECDFSRVIVQEGPNNFSRWDFIDCGLEPDDFEIRNMNDRSTLRVQNGDEAWELMPDGSVVEIEPFYAG